MRLQKTEYIRLWYLAGLVQFKSTDASQRKRIKELLNRVLPDEARKALAAIEEKTQEFKIIIPQDDEFILDGLIEVHQRFVNLFEEYESGVFDYQKDSNANEGKIAEPETQLVSHGEKIKDEDLKRIYALIRKIEEKHDITPQQIQALSFGLFETIPSSVEFYVRFQDTRNLYELIDLLNKHIDFPLSRFALDNLRALLETGYRLKSKNNYNYSHLDCAISDALHWLKECLKKTKFVFKTDQGKAKRQDVIEKYLSAMSEIFCHCNRINSYAITDHDKECKRKAKISETKKNDPKAKEKREILDKVRMKINDEYNAALQKGERINKKSICERYLKDEKGLREHKICLKTLQNRCSNVESNYKRSKYNSGETIQATFKSSELRDFREKYEEWLKTSEIKSNGDELDQDDHSPVFLTESERLSAIDEYISSLENKDNLEFIIIKALLTNRGLQPV